jgi:peptide/nickel transport system permease protein
VPSWGILISEGRAYLREAPWLTIVPGVAIAITALGLNLLGDGLRDVLDPRMKVEQG